jgi:glycosyltransferase involved in cell wall biosynthesis
MRFKEAIESSGDWSMDVISLDGLVGNSLSDLSKVRQAVLGWLSESRIAGVDFVHAEIGYQQHAALYALRFLRRAAPHIPYCVTVHDPPLVIAPALFPLALGTRSTLVRHALRVLDYTPLGRTVIRGVLARASHVFTLTRSGERALRQLLPGKREIEYLPLVDMRAGMPGPEGVADADRPLHVLFLGFWGPGKGISTLLAAVQRLSDDGVPVRLLLGGGPDSSAASRRFSDGLLERIRRSPLRSCVDLLGFVPPQEIDAVFDRSDVFAIPTNRSPGYSASSVQFRAAAAGVPVVASDLPAFREHVVNMKTGLLVPARDAAALAEALRLLAGDPRLRKRLGESARAHVRRRHSRTAVAARVLPIYRRIAEERAGRPRR